MTQPNDKKKMVEQHVNLPEDHMIHNIIVGPDKAFLSLLEQEFGGQINRNSKKPYLLRLQNENAANLLLQKAALTKMTEKTMQNNDLYQNDVVEIIRQVKREASNDNTEKLFQANGNEILVHGPKGKAITAKTKNQQELVNKSKNNDLVFAIGPAGSGKTYTAVALAVQALNNKKVDKIILTRPAVEAGESLGFLPGDLKEKIDPYLRPLYDALDDMIPAEKLSYYMQNRIIEIAPLAYMRGRTLSNAAVILDEAQNTTEMQMKMFLTRIGPDSKVIVTGDMSQNDLPKNVSSGLAQATRILGDAEGIAIVKLNGDDIVRHKLVKSIVAAYDKDDTNNQQQAPKARNEYKPS